MVYGARWPTAGAALTSQARRAMEPLPVVLRLSCTHQPQCFTWPGKRAWHTQHAYGWVLVVPCSAHRAQAACFVAFIYNACLQACGHVWTATCWGPVYPPPGHAATASPPPARNAPWATAPPGATATAHGAPPATVACQKSYPRRDGDAAVTSPRVDYTGVNTLDFKCSDGTPLSIEPGFEGDWTDWHECPPNTFICGMEVRSEAQSSNKDNSAINGVRVDCCRAPPSVGSSPASVYAALTLTVSEGFWGDWSDTSYCQSIVGDLAMSMPVRGFRLKVQETSVPDNTGLHAVETECSDGRSIQPGDYPIGRWTSWSYCPAGAYVTGSMLGLSVWLALLEVHGVTAVCKCQACGMPLHPQAAALACVCNCHDHLTCSRSCALRTLSTSVSRTTCWLPLQERACVCTRRRARVTTWLPTAWKSSGPAPIASWMCVRPDAASPHTTPRHTTGPNPHANTPLPACLTDRQTDGQTD